jgi:hypothetical protein
MVGAAAASFDGTAKAMPFQSNLCNHVLCCAVMMSGGKGGAGKDEHQENSSEKLLHAPNVARALL